MGRTPRVPRELRARPFSLDEARAVGVSLSALRGKSWRRLGSKMYCWRATPEDGWELIQAYRRALPASAVFVGRTAAWIHGIGIEPDHQVEVALPADSKLRPRTGLHVRHCDVSEAEVKRGVRVTRLERTLLDVCFRLAPVEALVVLDMALFARLTTRQRLGRYAERVAGRPGAARLRWLGEIAEPAESPMETRLRWLLIQARLPAPEVQKELHDDAGHFIGRADLYYPEGRLVIEFDGGNHRDRLTQDNRRQNALVAAGYRVLRFTGADMRERPDAVVAEVRAEITSAQLGGNVRNRRRESAR